MCRITSEPRWSVRFSVIPCLFRLTQLNCGAHSHQKSSVAPPARQPSIRCTDSTLITSAPPSAKTSEVIGPRHKHREVDDSEPFEGSGGEPPSAFGISPRGVGGEGEGIGVSFRGAGGEGSGGDLVGVLAE